VFFPFGRTNAWVFYLIPKNNILVPWWGRWFCY